MIFSHLTSAALAIAGSLIAAPAEPVRASDVLTVPPTIQLGEQVANGANSIAIVWQTPDVDQKLNLKATQGHSTLKSSIAYRSVKVNGVLPHRVYTAELTGWRPGEQIHFEIVADGSSVFQGAVMAPKSDRQSYNFAVFGDCGCASPEEAEISYQAYKTKPDLLLLTGDLVYGNGTAKEYQTNFWPYYTADIASPKTGSPLLSAALTVAAPGNHDILNRHLDQHPDGLAFFYNWSQPLNGPDVKSGDPSTPTLSGAAPVQAAFIEAAGSNYPKMANFSFDYGNAHITSLDANPYVNWSDPKMRAWLRADLAKGKSKTWRFVMFHQPGFQSSDEHQGEKQMRQVADLFEEAKVDVVFMGHVHNYQRSYPIQVGPKAGVSKEELAKDDWPVDKSFDGVKNTHPKGVIYLVDGAGGNDLYNPELNGKPELWKPFQATYFALWSFSTVTVTGNKFVLKQLDRNGSQIDGFTITK